MKLTILKNKKNLTKGQQKELNYLEFLAIKDKNKAIERAHFLSANPNKLPNFMRNNFSDLMEFYNKENRKEIK